MTVKLVFNLEVSVVLIVSYQCYEAMYLALLVLLIFSKLSSVGSTTIPCTSGG